MSDRLILHISFDFPDDFDRAKTPAVKLLVDSATDFNNIVFSLNRSTKLKTNIINRNSLISMRVFGLPGGLFLRSSMKACAKLIAREVTNMGLKPALLHGHKLSYEGIICKYLSRLLGVPYVLTLRGYTDLKIIKFKPHLGIHYKKIIENARAVFCGAPWPINHFIQKLKLIQRCNIQLLPNIVKFKSEKSTCEVYSDTFVTALNFVSYKRKKILNVLRALEILWSKGCQCKLHIIGDGPNKEKIEAAITKSSHPERIKMLGRKKQDELAKMLPQYVGFVLPSFPETFGMVFIEALMSGIPIIYAKGTGIDGFFDEFNVGEKVEHDKTANIAEAMEKIIVSRADYIKSIEDMKSTNYLTLFSSDHIGRKYEEMLAACF